MPGLEGSGEAVGVLRAAGTLKLGFPELGFATALPSPRGGGDPPVTRAPAAHAPNIG